MIYSDFIKAEFLKTDFIWTFYLCKRCLKIHLGVCGQGSASEGSYCQAWWHESMSWDPYNRRRDSVPSVVSVLHTCALPTYTGQSCHDADTIYIAPAWQMEFCIPFVSSCIQWRQLAGTSVPYSELPAFALSSALETGWPRVTGEACPLTTDCPPLILRLVLRVHTLGSTFWKFVPTHADPHVCGAAWVAGIAPGGVWKCLKTVSADVTCCVQLASRRQKSCTHLCIPQHESRSPVQRMNTNHKLNISDAPLVWMPLPHRLRKFFFFFIEPGLYINYLPQWWHQRLLNS